MSEKDTINVKEILGKSSDAIAAVIKSLGHPKRLVVVNALWSEPSAFIDLQKVTGLSKTALVHHLDKLVENGIVNRLERGKYELTDDGKELVSASIAAYAKSQKRKEDEATRRVETVWSFSGATVSSPGSEAGLTLHFLLTSIALGPVL